MVRIISTLLVLVASSLAQDYGNVRNPSFLSFLSGQMGLHTGNTDVPKQGRQYDLSPPENAPVQSGDFMYDAIKQMNPITQYLQQTKAASSDQNQTIIAILIPVPVAAQQPYYQNMPNSPYYDQQMPRNPSFLSGMTTQMGMYPQNNQDQDDQTEYGTSSYPRSRFQPSYDSSIQENSFSRYLFRR